MEDYNSKYTGARVEEILDSVEDKQDKITDLDTIRDGSSKGATAVQTYVVPFDILQLLGGDTISGVHFHELETAINEHKLILIPVEAGSPVFGYLPMSVWTEGDIYFSVLFDDTIIYGEIAVNSEEIYASDIKIIKPELKQDALVSGENIKTINGESILGNGNIEISGGIDSEVYIADFTRESLRRGTNNGNQVDCDMQALITALNANKIILVRDNADSTYKGVYVLNGYAEDLLYFSIVEIDGSILWCEGTDFGVDYIDGRNLHIRNWNKKQDTISDLETIREGASKGITALQTYIVDFDILELTYGEDILNIRTDLLIEAINTHKLILIPFSKEDPLMGYLPVSAYYEDYVYLGISNGATHIDVNIGLDENKIYASDIKVFNLFNTQDRLVSGSNIKTINGESVLGTGDIEIGGGKKIVPNKQDAMSFSFIHDSENGPLEPNKIYICHNTEILSVIISDIIPPEDLYGEYTCLFKFGGASVDSLALILPDHVLWANGTAPQLEVQTSYELSITATKFIDDYIYKAVLTPFKPVE